MLSNTYHLYLRPGHTLIRELGGLQQFMQWSGPILTDSGGFQVFSMAALRRVDDDGVSFRSHLDGSEQRLTPESSMEIQAALGSDIVMAFDECPDRADDRGLVAEAVRRTSLWARRCRECYQGPGVPFGIVQGGVFPELREASVRDLVALDFPGYAIGGVCVGEPRESILPTIGATTSMLPADRPSYLMGVGLPEDLDRAVAQGVDLFDCVLPTRTARNGTLFTSSGNINIKRAEYRRDPRPLDERCRCEACTGYSRAYLRHLFVSGEILAARLHTIHNLTYYLDLMKKIRQAVADMRFADLVAEFDRSGSST